MNLFKKIKSFFANVKDEVKKSLADEGNNGPEVWDYIETEVIKEDEIVDETSVAPTPTTSEINIEDIDGDKKVLKITKEGKIIAVYDSINDVMDKHSSYTYSGIHGCICGRRQTYRGFIFKYKKDLLNG